MDKTDNLLKKLNLAKGDEKLNILIEIIEALKKSDPDKSKAYLIEALELTKKSKLKYEKGIIYNLYANLLYRKGNLHDAIKFYLKALKNIDKNKNPEYYSGALNYFGTSQARIGNPDKAFESFTKALTLLDNKNLHNCISYLNTINNIGVMYFMGQEWQKAREYYKKALSIANELHYNPGIENALLNIGVSYKNEKKDINAIKYFKKGLKLSEENNFNYMSIKFLLSLSDAYGNIEKFDHAFPLLEKALKLCEEIDDTSQIIEVYFYFAKLKHKEKNFPGKIEYLKKALTISDSKDLIIHRFNIFQELSSAYEETGDFKSALKYYKNFFTLHKQMIDESSMKKLKEIQVKLETEQKERKIEFLQKEKIIKDLQIKAKEEELIKKKNKEIEINKMNKILEQRVQEELKKREEQQLLLAQKSKLESLGKLAAGIAHEINQPITNISLGVGNILARQKMNKLEDGYLIEKCNNFYENIKRINKIINQIRIFSRDRKSIIFKRIKVNETINNTLLLIKTQYGNHRIILETNLDENIGNILGDEYKLEQVFINLLGNARDAIESKRIGSDKTLSKGKIKIVTYNKKNKIYIEITDSGTGIAEDKIDTIFDPFYTTKDPEKGTGLGLSIVYGIIQEMNGEISAQSKLNEFTTIKIVLPKV